jgi:hypothetical protein
MYTITQGAFSVTAANNLQRPTKTVSYKGLDAPSPPITLGILPF